MSDAIVVGAGPNGLAAAITLAEAGLDVTVLEAADDIGGGTRTRELISSGVVHDLCSAVHPFALLSPFFRSLDLERHGLRWRWPEVDLSHPLDGGRVGVLLRSLDSMAAALGRDGAAWRRLFEPISRDLRGLTDDIFRPLLHVPKHPLEMAQFGVRAFQPATLLARCWHSEEARALFGGAAAHTIHPLTRPLTSAVGVTVIAAAHSIGWPVAEGGSQSITNAMASRLRELGGTIQTGVLIKSLKEVPRSRVLLLDTSPAAAADIVGDCMPRRVARAYRRWRHGPAAFKVDLVVRGGIPWADDASPRAGTVHCGGTLEEIVHAERAVHEGRMPERPFVLVAQQSVADPTRSCGDLHPVWSYAHVPNGFDGDITDAVIGQIERFAPGLRDCIVGVRVRSAPAFEEYNPNFVGGDILNGSNAPLQVMARPRISFDPYSTGVPGIYLCSASTPPGAGVHGMCGFNAARSAVRALCRRGRD